MNAEPRQSKRVVVVANKAWEAAPLCAALAHPKATYGPYLTALGRRMRGLLQFPTCQVEIWCLQDFLSDADQSKSDKKWAVLPQIVGASADLVIAFGTAASAGADSLNGCVVMGSRVFMHDVASDPSKSPWPSGDTDLVQRSEVGGKLLGGAAGSDRDYRARAESRFVASPLRPAKPPVLLLAPNYCAVGDVNVPTYDDYVWADQAALDAFRAIAPREAFGSLETTHGLIRLSTTAPFIFVSGITDRIGLFNEEVGPRDYAQNFVAAHNAAIALGNLLPALVTALGGPMADSFTLVVDFNNPPWVPNKTIALPYVPKATVRDALYAAFDQVHAGDPQFTFDLAILGQRSRRLRAGAVRRSHDGQLVMGGIHQRRSGGFGYRLDRRKAKRHRGISVRSR